MLLRDETLCIILCPKLNLVGEDTGFVDLQLWCVVCCALFYYIRESLVVVLCMH